MRNSDCDIGEITDDFVVDGCLCSVDGSLWFGVSSVMRLR